MSSVDRRSVGAAFAATLKVTTDSPCPVVWSGTIQGALDFTLHEQSRVVEIPTLPEPPEGGNGAGAPVGLTLHRATDGAVTCSTAVEPHPGSARIPKTRSPTTQRTHWREQSICHTVLRACDNSWS
jgi:hypothetical protein